MELLRLLFLLAALCVRLGPTQSLQNAAVPQYPISLPSHQLQTLCSDFAVMCNFVVTNCNPKRPPLLGNPQQLVHSNPKCIESFNLFYQLNNTLSSCIQQASRHSQTQALAFLEIYSSWKHENVCKLFYTTEAKAAAECSGVNVHRPWKQTTWPLFCHEVFTIYNSTRHKLDHLCERTSNSEAFWEGYVDYISSKTCKTYYDIVRQARERGCGSEAKALYGTECWELFQWYMTNKDVVETDCYELKASKAFYHGFYTWKKTRN